MTLEDVLELGGANVELVKFAIGINVGSMSGGEIVNDYHLVTEMEAGICDVRADEPSTSGDQDS